MKFLCSLIVVCVLLILAVELEAKKSVLKKRFEKSRLRLEAKQKKYTELCEKIKCKQSKEYREGCKVKHGVATCIRCHPCNDKISKPVCGTNGKTYQSPCHLRYTACVQNKIHILKIKCFGSCKECDVDINKTPKSENKKKEEKSIHLNESQLQKLRAEEAAKLKQKKKYRKWKQWKEYRQAYKHFTTTREHAQPVLSRHNCSKMDNDSLAIRLLDWFHVLRAEHIRIHYKKNHDIELHRQLFKKMNLEDAKMPYPETGGHCRQPINWMFSFLDLDQNGYISDKELEEVRKLSYEPCMSQFFDSCDKKNDNLFDLREFCDCFPVEPPCLAELKGIPSLRQRGQVIPMPGFDLPECDQDGFYLPAQCHANEKKGGEDWCWCVDRNGGMVEGTYRKGYHECPDNTEGPKSENEEGEDEQENDE